jgi:hypothetical protein
MKSCMLTVVYFSVLQHKIVFLQPHGTFTDRFSVCVVTTGKIKWLRADITVFRMSPQILILSATINCILVLRQPQIRVT